MPKFHFPPSNTVNPGINNPIFNKSGVNDIIRGTVARALAGLHENIAAFTGDHGLPNLRGLLSISFQQSLVFFSQLFLSEIIDTAAKIARL
jgi:hypothetical protein